ncbi:MAG: low molecular weight protein-tyrosine-phosphatase [Flavobacteriaceae bacterium]|nr:low molecular weight protein-tyrosine-phosphatase [Flavobacteriaceae bacterium]
MLNNKKKILVVCLGNICRSPLAHGLLEKKLDPEKFEIDSAGTGNYHVGSPPDHRSVKVADKNGLDISNQRARQFQQSDFDSFDLIYAMDESNYSDILQLARNEQDRSKVKLILDEVYPNEKLNVPDPYLGNESLFDEVYQMLDSVTEQLSQRLQAS